MLQMIYGIRSERMLMEQMHYNLLSRWFVGLSLNDTVWHPTVFPKNRDRGWHADRSLGHVMTENRNGLVVNTRLTLATGTAEREAAIAMADDTAGGIRNKPAEEDRFPQIRLH